MNFIQNFKSKIKPGASAGPFCPKICQLSFMFSSRPSCQSNPYVFQRHQFLKPFYFVWYWFLKLCLKNPNAKKDWTISYRIGNKWYNSLFQILLLGTRVQIQNFQYHWSLSLFWGQHRTWTKVCFVEDNFR